MALKPYEEYEKAADVEAEAKHKKWMIPLAVVFAAIGAVITVVLIKVLFVIGGLLIGALVGWLIYRLIINISSGNTAAANYTADWCAENGCRMLGDDVSPPNGPYANSGVRQDASDAIEGQFGEYSVLFYNFSYWTESTDSDGDTTETEHPYKIMRLTGKTLPIERLTMKERGFMNLQAFDKLQGAVTKERPVKLESVEFNKKFDLTIDDNADDIWIRRIFDPATIQASVEGKLDFPDLRYYDQAWWLVESKHYKAKELDSLKPWQARAAVAIDHLSRVQDL